jgi:protoheme IX farnesyltransferase
MTLLLYTGACAYLAAARGLGSPRVFTEFLFGLALAWGGASALNHALEADIDRLMGSRTRDRPVAAARISAVGAAGFGLILSALGVALLAATVNLTAAGLALAGGVFYVLVYTRWLKRSTPQNIVIGGAAGAVPPLVGWAAATGTLPLAALFLFAIVFLWTPPHFWALALLLKRDYQAAGIPMLPVVRGDRETSNQILLYSLISSRRRSSPSRRDRSGPSTSLPRSYSAARSLRSRSGCDGRSPPAPPPRSFGTRSSTSRCSSMQSPSTESSRDPPQGEPPYQRRQQHDKGRPR